jgi:hypothetical protein
LYISAFWPSKCKLFEYDFILSPWIIIYDIGQVDYYLLLLYLFTAIGFAPGGSSPILVQTKTIKQHYTVVQHNTIQ